MKKKRKHSNLMGSAPQPPRQPPSTSQPHTSSRSIVTNNNTDNCDMNNKPGSILTTKTTGADKSLPSSFTDLVVPHLICFVDHCSASSRRSDEDDNSNSHHQVVDGDQEGPNSSPQKQEQSSVRLANFERSVLFLTQFLQDHLEVVRNNKKNNKTQSVGGSCGTDPDKTHGDGGRCADSEDLDSSTNSTRMAVACQDRIAQLLLPWAVQQLLRKPTSHHQATADAPPSTSILDTKKKKEKKTNNNNFDHPESPQSPPHEPANTTTTATTDLIRTDSLSPTIDLYQILNVSLQTLLLFPKTRSNDNNNKDNSNNPHRPFLTSILNQSTLGKLIPPMLIQALTTTTTTTTTHHDEVTNSAARVYVTLLSAPTASTAEGTSCWLSFRPTLEFALQSILLPMIQHELSSAMAVVGIDHEKNKKDKRNQQQQQHDNHHHKLVVTLANTTLQWIQTAVMVRGNPKTTFQLLVQQQQGQPMTLAAMSILYHDPHFFGCSSSNEIKENDDEDGTNPHYGYDLDTTTTTKKQGRYWIRRILSQGVVNGQHHLEGLLPLLLQHRQRRIQTQHQQENQKVPKTNNDDTKENTSFPKSKSSSFRCYQEELLSCIESFFIPTIRKTDKLESAIALQQQSEQKLNFSPSQLQRAGIRVLPVLMEQFLLQLDQFFQSKQQLSGIQNNTKRRKIKTTTASNASPSSSSSSHSGPAFEFVVLMVTPLLSMLQSQSHFRRDSTASNQVNLSRDDDNNDNDIVAVLQSMRQLTRLLLVHNVYIASQDDATKSKARFLESIVTTVLFEEHQRQKQGDKNSNPAPRLLTDSLLAPSIETLQTILQLNHNLLHDRLVSTLILVCSFSVCDDYETNQKDCTKGDTCKQAGPTTGPRPKAAAMAAAEQFWIFLLETYQKLRQQSHLVQCILQVISTTANVSDSPSKDNDNGKNSQDGRKKASEALRWLLHESASVKLSLSHAIQASPLSEIESMFTVLEQWFTMNHRPSAALSDVGGAADSGMRKDSDDHHRSFVLALAGEFAVLLFQAFPVQQATASTISGLVTHFMETVVNPLSSSTGSPASTSPFLRCCAWLIRLQEQCVFWLGRLNHDQLLAIPSNVQVHVQRALLLQSKTFGAEQDGYDESILLLVSHRLQQIASLIHNEQLAQIHSDDQMTDANDRSDRERDLKAEGQTLSTLLTQAALLDKPESSPTIPRNHDGWIYIAQCVHVWTSFATDDAIRQFLSWVVTSLSIEESNPASSDKELVRHFHEQEHRRVSMDLVMDMQFLDNQRIGSQLHLVALKCCAKWIAEALGFQFHESMATLWDKLSEHKSPFVLDDCFFEHVVSSSTSSTSPVPAATADDCSKLILRVVRVLRIIKGLPSELLDAGDNVQVFFRVAAWLERETANRIAKKEAPCRHGSLLTLVSALRYVLGKAFSAWLRFPGKESEDANIDADVLELQLKYVDHVLSSTKHILQSTEIEEELWIDEFLSSSEILLSKLTCHLIQKTAIGKDGSAKYLGRVVSLVSLPEEKDPSSRSVSRRRHFIGGLVAIKSLLCGAEHARASFLANDEHSNNSGFLFNLWRQSWKSFGDFAGRSSYGETHKALTRAVLGDMVRFMKQWNVQDDNALTRLQNLVKRDLKETVSGEGKSRRTAHYNLACLVKVRPSYQHVQIILDELCKDDIGNTMLLLEAAFCDLLTHLDSIDCCSAVERLTVQVQHVNHASLSVRLRLCTLLLRLPTNGENITEAISKQGFEFLELALSPLFAFRCKGSDDDNNTKRRLWVQQTVEANQLLCTLIRRKDVLLLRDKDLTVILSSLNSVVGGSQLDDDDSKTAGPTAVFIGCTRTLLLLIHRCSKQLYACVPLVISVLLSFLNFCMDLTPGRSDVTTCTSELCRLCEALVAHRDIYKKHVIGLLLEFVLKIPSTPLLVKNAVLPSIHCLLDILSVHEQKQLNALMDTPSKSNFRSIYHNYQKLHAYKGQ